jgi:DNA repair protein RadC
MGEKFSVAEVTALRNELLQGGLDSFQTAELLKMFLAGRGYGVSTESALDAAGRIESGFNVETLHKELESLALVM